MKAKQTKRARHKAGRANVGRGLGSLGVVAMGTALVVVAGCAQILGMEQLQQQSGAGGTGGSGGVAGQAAGGAGIGGTAAGNVCWFHHSAFDDGCKFGP